MQEEQLRAAASPLAFCQVQLHYTIDLGGSSASPPPWFATASFILIQQSSDFSAELRHAGRCAYTSGHSKQCGLKLVLSGEPEGVVIHLNHCRHLACRAIPQTQQHDSGNLERTPSTGVETTKKVLCSQLWSHVFPQTWDMLLGGHSIHP